MWDAIPGQVPRVKEAAELVVNGPALVMVFFRPPPCSPRRGVLTSWLTRCGLEQFRLATKCNIDAITRCAAIQIISFWGRSAKTRDTWLSVVERLLVCGMAWLSLDLSRSLRFTGCAAKNWGQNLNPTLRATRRSIRPLPRSLGSATATFGISIDGGGD
jgi:hypothetical protein